MPASTFLAPCGKTWMAGTTPAMTERPLHASISSAQSKFGAECVNAPAEA